jgi:hypothetical protein
MHMSTLPVCSLLHILCAGGCGTLHFPYGLPSIKYVQHGGKELAFLKLVVEHSDYRLQITDYRLAPSKWGAREEPTSAPWATIEDTLSS